MDVTEHYFVYRNEDFISYVDCRKQLQYHFYYDNPTSKKKIYKKYNQKFNIEPREFESFIVRGNKITINEITFEVNFVFKNRIIQVFNTFEGKRYLLVRMIIDIKEIVTLEKIVSLESGWAFIFKKLKKNQKETIQRELFFIHKKKFIQKEFILTKKNNYQLTEKQKQKSYQKIISVKNQISQKISQNVFYLSGKRK